MSDDLEPLRQHAQQSNVVKSLVPFYLRYHIKKSWIYTQSYYDDPEGKNLFGKLVAINKIVAGPVAVLAWADILMISKVTDYQRMVGRLSYYAYPFFGAASCFAIGTYAATNIRGKDDSWNYIIGGFSAGGAIGMWLKSVPAGWGWGAVFAFAALVKKQSIILGFELFPYLQHQPTGLRTAQRDYSIYTSSIPKGYDIVSSK